MSALVGLYFRGGRAVGHEELDAMLGSMAHRGSDATGTWRRGSVGLGQRMLWTTPESLHEKLPLLNEQTQLSLTADARIDNREDLLAALDFAGRRPSEIADGELILAAYEKWGEDCPAHLLGDFAFAIWDAPRRRLFCARDHFGVRQLYYYSSPKLFACATEIKAILALKDVPRRLNELRVADYLLSLFEDKTATLYEEIYALAPGHSLVVNEEGARAPRPYWSLDPERELKLGSDAEYVESYVEIFTEAVRCRMRRSGGARPLGSALSGGLDSSSITCAARKLLAEEGGGQTLHTFSAVYDDVPECDERRYINTVLAQGGVEPHFGHPDRHSPLADWEGESCAHDEPLWNPQIALHWVLYEAAERQRVRVLLDGFGGDAVVSYGAGYLADVARSWDAGKMLGEAKAQAKRLGVPLGRVLWRQVAVPLLVSTPAWRLCRRLRPRDERWMNGAPLRAEFAERLDLKKRASSLPGTDDRPAPRSRLRHWLGITSGYNSFILGVANRTTSLFGIERRHPFADKRLVEFCLALPTAQKTQDGWGRWIARRANADILPAAIQWRVGKTDHSANFHRGLLGEDRKILEDTILNSSGRMAEYVDAGILREVYRRYFSRQSKSNSSDGFVLWRVVKLALWLRRSGFDVGRGGGAQA